MFDHNAGQAVLLGFQHYLLTLGITVLIPTIIVPQMGGGDVRIFFEPFSFYYKTIFMIVLLKQML